MTPERPRPSQRTAHSPSNRLPGWALFLLLVPAAAMLPGCTTTTTEKVPDKPEVVSTAPTHFPKEVQEFHRPDDIVRGFDLNGDGKADLWKVYRPAEGSETSAGNAGTESAADAEKRESAAESGGAKAPEDAASEAEKAEAGNAAADGKAESGETQAPAQAAASGQSKTSTVALGRLVRKEIDLNHDGRPDIWRYYDESGATKLEAFDFDFDGHIDQVSLYEGGVVVKKGQDLDGNGESDQWITYEKGAIVKKERDTNANGQIDYWEYWEDGAVSRIGIDEDGDGQVDRWSKAPRAGGDD